MRRNYSKWIKIYSKRIKINTLCYNALWKKRHTECMSLIVFGINRVFSQFIQSLLFSWRSIVSFYFLNFFSCLFNLIADSMKSDNESIVFRSSLITWSNWYNKQAKAINKITVEYSSCNTTWYNCLSVDLSRFS